MSSRNKLINFRLTSSLLYPNVSFNSVRLTTYTNQPVAQVFSGQRRRFCSTLVVNTSTQQQRQSIRTQLDAASYDSLSTQKAFASVVKVFCDHTDPNFSLPWQMRRQGSSTGSGFVIENKRLMTNAHVVAYQNRVLVKKPGDSKRYPAQVEAVSHEADLAILSIDDLEFWRDLDPLTFGDLPELQDNVVVLGYPQGGDNLCVTRLDVTTYSHSNFKLLCAQIDAAINPGSSGGPAFNLANGVVSGVAFQGFNDAQNIGYIVPTNVIKQFLRDVELNKKYTGFVSLGVTYQTLENVSMKTFFGLNSVQSSQLPAGVSPTGILIIQVDEVKNERFRESQVGIERGDGKNREEKHYGLRKNDILISLNGTDVGDDATIIFRGMERVHLSHAITKFFSGDSVSALVLRDRKLVEVQVPLFHPDYLVPEHQWDKVPRYFIFGGCVFVPLSLDYLKDEFGKKYYERCPPQLMVHLSQYFMKHPQQEVVILSQILASELTIGYDLRNSRLHKVDGIPVQNLNHLIRILANNAKEQFVEFELDHEVRVILDRSAVREQTPSLLKQHQIPKLWSDDLESIIEESKFR